MLQYFMHLLTAFKRLVITCHPHLSAFFFNNYTLKSACIILMLCFHEKLRFSKEQEMQQ